MPKKVAKFTVAERELRRMFNEGRYWERMKSGELFEVIYRDGHPSPRTSGEPPCTRSQIIAYLDAQGRQIAVIHQYLRKDGRIGGSGKPDPKKLFYKGSIYAAD